MYIVSLIASLLLSINPPNNYLCQGEPLSAKIYNNLNGDYMVAEDLSTLDPGAFAVLEWKKQTIMIPRTFNSGEISFTDKKWWWSYKERENPIDVDHPRFRFKVQTGEIEDYECQSVFPEVEEIANKSKA